MMYRNLRILGIIAIAIGLAGLLPFNYFWVKDKMAITTASPSVIVPVGANRATPETPLITGKPTQIVIPSLNINLQIIDGYYSQKTGKWTLTLDKAQYATPSVQPNNLEGNTFIYGHYRPQVFASLHRVQAKAEAYIITDNGYRFSYSYHSSETYDPTDTSVFAYTGIPRLTLQTCSGTWMQNRQMYYFSYISYQKI